MVNVAYKQSAKDAFETASKRATQKTAEATGDLICNKIYNQITKVSENLQHHNPETVTNKNDIEIPKEIYIYIYREREREKRKKMII